MPKGKRDRYGIVAGDLTIEEAQPPSHGREEEPALPNPQRLRVLLQVLVHAVRDPSRVRGTTWPSLVALAVQYGAGLDPSVQAAELHQLAEHRLGDVLTHAYQGGPDG